MPRGLTEQFTELLFDRDVIESARNPSKGSASVYAHYPNGSKLRVLAIKTDLIRLEETADTGARKIVSLRAREAMEYVKRWSLDLESGEVFATSIDEVYSAARDLLEELGNLERVDMDTSAVDVEKFAAHITYPRVGNYSVHGLLLRLPSEPHRLNEILRACTHEE